MTNPEVRFLQISDLHLMQDGQLLYDRVDTWKQFCTALSAASHFRPDAVVLTGDIYNGDIPQSQEFKSLVAQARQELGCPVLVLPGNHDHPNTLTAGFDDAPTAGPEPGDGVYHVQGMRVITLNTHGQQTLQGHLTAAQLAWLRSELQTRAASGTLLAMHHPPTPTAHQFLSTVGLADPSRLAAAVQDSDVRLIISGHLHFPTAAMLGSIPVWSGPALAYQQNPYAPHGTLQGFDAPGISVIDFFADSHAIVPVPLDIPTALFSRPIPTEPQPAQHSY